MGLSQTLSSGTVSSVFIEVENMRMWPDQKMLDADIIEHMRQYDFIPFLRDILSITQYNIIFLHKGLFSKQTLIFYDYYMNSLDELAKRLSAP